jgi:hypothetical protein
MQPLLEWHEGFVSRLVGHAGIEKLEQTQTPPSSSTVGQVQPQGTFGGHGAPGVIVDPSAAP